jgi:nickel-dependent lactate racemase
MATWTLDWRDGPLTVDVPDRNLRQTVSARDMPPRQAEWTDLVRQAIEHPIGSPPLRDLLKPGMRLAILLTDVHDGMFGQKERVGPWLFDYLNAAGIPDDRILLVHAAGLHGHGDAIGRIGPEVLGRVRYHEHDPLDESCLTFRGATWQGTPVWINKLAAECDMILGFGGCGPSLFGFQGGAGIILPGISAADTIRQNHIKIMNSQRVISGWWPGNPQRMDVMDAGDLAGFRFKIDVTGNAVFAGYFREEWPIAVEYVKEHQLTRVAPTDIYVYAPSSSRELANTLYMQLEYGSAILRPGGIFIVVAESSDHVREPDRPVEQTLAELAYMTVQWNRESGPGDPAVRAYWRKRDVVCKEELMRLPLDELSKVVVRKLGEPRSTTMSWSHRRCLEQTRTFLVSAGVSPEEGLSLGFAHVTRSFDEALERAFAELGRDASVVVNAAGGTYAGTAAPQAGIPYPIEE